MELGLRVEYDTHKFGAAEIATVVARFERLLEAMTADADQLVSAIGALTRTSSATSTGGRIGPC